MCFKRLRKDSVPGYQLINTVILQSGPFSFEFVIIEPGRLRLLGMQATCWPIAESLFETLQGLKIFFLYRLQTGFGAHTPPYFTFGALLTRMWPAIEADYLSSSVEVKNYCRCTSTFHVPSRFANKQLNFDFFVNLIKQRFNLSKICKNN